MSVEEAYGILTALPNGLTPKFGRFFSGLGYLNEQHQHAWDFIDAPLAYQAFLGGQYGNDGVQLKWVAPTDQFLELGAEVGNGAGFPGTERNKNGAGSGVVYAHTGGDIGESHSWRAGLSYLQTRAQDREFGTDRPRRQRRAARASPARATSRSPTSSGSTRPTATRRTPTSSCRASTSGGASAAT